jgi:hypothetical protein
MAARFSGAAPAPEISRASRPAAPPVAGLADEDATAYQAVLETFALPGGAAGRRGADPGHAARRGHRAAGNRRGRGTGRRLATEVAADGNPNLRGTPSPPLAEASARSAAALVDINVRLGSLPADLSQRAARAWPPHAAATRAANQKAGEQ